MKKINNHIFTFLFLIFLPYLVKSTPVSIKVINQYEASVVKLSFIENGKSTDILLDSDGSCVIEITGTEAVILKAENHTDLTVQAAGFIDGATIAMHKKFSWKDLINPMFYII